MPSLSAHGGVACAARGITRGASRPGTRARRHGYSCVSRACRRHGACCRVRFLLLVTRLAWGHELGRHAVCMRCMLGWAGVAQTPGGGDVREGGRGLRGRRGYDAPAGSTVGDSRGLRCPAHLDLDLHTPITNSTPPPPRASHPLCAGLLSCLRSALISPSMSSAISAPCSICACLRRSSPSALTRVSRSLATSASRACASWPILA